MEDAPAPLLALMMGVMNCSRKGVEGEGSSREDGPVLLLLLLLLLMLPSPAAAAEPEKLLLLPVPLCSSLGQNVWNRLMRSPLMWLPSTSWSAMIITLP